MRPIYGASRTKKLPLYSETRFRNVVNIYTYIHEYNSDDGEHPDYFFYNAIAPSGPGPHRYRGFTITHGHTKLGSIPLDE
jgi:hypothetical protein